ncbi:multidrug resistance protein ABC superfamily [Phytophthora sojae]|uniref:Multidrug resistance protein ABC superfamily n=1 Tax=Phytophthora sojae (strain P6497) TaxID=1094619 RepID=G5ADH3_PHYSP|nr:multidrug resistance protein ABC superfamily [Phytophthora sojae]EGZ06226.1 multidrug resistance protein ABC superfamily [Phytophthora sojae]|eukprot:XP_009538123.1 multidrug resistance protein ABC superfamily [Phytophthora sojae]
MADLAKTDSSRAADAPADVAITKPPTPFSRGSLQSEPMQDFVEVDGTTTFAAPPAPTYRYKLSLKSEKLRIWLEDCKTKQQWDCAKRQMKALRSEALKHMLYMDISWYDENDALQLSSRLTGDTVRIMDGMGQKLGDAFRFTIQFCVGFIIGFARGWDITLVMACVMPAMTVSLSWLIKTMRIKSDWAQKVYVEAGSVAEETLGSIRIVASLNGEHRAIAKFESKVFEAEKENITLHKMTSVVFPKFVASIWVMYSIGLWYGGWKASKGNAAPGDVFAAFFGVLMGASSLAQISPNVTAVSKAAGAAEELFAILDTASAIDAEKEDEGVIPDTCEGKIEAVNVNFTYRSRPEAPILRDYNVTIDPGIRCGTIYLVGRDVKTLNVKWLRSQIGMVSQEPVLLFATTIFENIAMGGDSVTREETIEACKLSNAHNFIMSLPEQYDTLVGEKGVSLSGGQKQRVAIAGAIVHKPNILVLDEATSALDNESEKIVQAALNNLMATMNMTTLVIVHRLSTIRHADKIVVLNEGHIMESGTHDELLKIEHGIYQNMYRVQELRSQEEQYEVKKCNSENEQRNTKLTHTLSGVSAMTDISVSAVEKNFLDKKPFGFMDMLKLNRLEANYFIIGFLGSSEAGIAMPVSALLVSGMITSMTEQYGEYQSSGDSSHLTKLYNDMELYGILYLVGAIVVAIFSFMQIYCFKFMEEKITTRLRNVNFRGLCRQNVGIFDEKVNATGALTADLATNATKVSLLAGESQSRAFQALFTLIAALVVSFGFGSWLLSLIMTALIPLLLLGQVARLKQMGSSGLISDDLAAPGSHASEVLSNIRTVAALGIEKKAVGVFDDLQAEPLRKGRKEAQVNGLSLGFSSFILMATFSLIFWFGARKVNDGSIEFTEMMRTLMAVTMSIQNISNASTFLSDAPKAFKAGSTMFAIRDRVAPIDSFCSDGLRPAKVNISFRYPTRPEINVLKNYNLAIEPGQTVAFCGPSGGGNTRFYDPVVGDVLLDGHNIKDLNLNWLRRQIGLVGQEPTLFIGTIAENIGYGLAEQPSQQEIEEAAKMANAHDFITQFPDGYETQVGMKGEQLSGGQKQRIAIARAILKNPNILLLDEATSALDSESEKVVQEALDKVVALKRRTTIIIAHRLSTIRKADNICVSSFILRRHKVLGTGAGSIRVMSPRHAAGGSYSGMSNPLKYTNEGVPKNWSDKDWQTYKWAMMNMFKENKLKEIAVGDLTRAMLATASAERLEAFDAAQLKIMRMVGTSVPPDVLQQIRDKETGSEMWAELCNLYEGKQNEAIKAYTIRRGENEMWSMKLTPGGDKNLHLCRMFNFKTELADLQHVIADNTMVDMLLESLPDQIEFERLKSSIYYGADPSVSTHRSGFEN